jgi:molybdenum cofactor guanylyltransferase
MITDIVGVVVVGGKSSRMGRDKASVRFGGVSLLERTVAVLSEVFDTVLVAGESAARVEVERVTDVIAHGGPLSGLDAVYERAEIVGSGAVPLSARVPVTHGRLQPLCALYGADLGGLVRERLESDDRSMFGFISSIEEVDLLEMDPAVFDNVNTPEDLASALKRFGQPRSTH